MKNTLPVVALKGEMNSQGISIPPSALLAEKHRRSRSLQSDRAPSIRNEGGYARRTWGGLEIHHCLCFQSQAQAQNAGREDGRKRQLWQYLQSAPEINSRLAPRTQTAVFVMFLRTHNAPRSIGLLCAQPNPRTHAVTRL